MPTTERLLSTGELATQLLVKPQTIRLWRLLGRGPRFVRLSASRVAYDPRDVQAWIEQRKADSVAEEKARKAEAGAAA